jgi:hypothetical protein
MKHLMLIAAVVAAAALTGCKKDPRTEFSTHAVEDTGWVIDLPARTDIRKDRQDPRRFRIVGESGDDDGEILIRDEPIPDEAAAMATCLYGHAVARKVGAGIAVTCLDTSISPRFHGRSWQPGVTCRHAVFGSSATDETAANVARRVCGSLRKR